MFLNQGKLLIRKKLIPSLNISRLSIRAFSSSHHGHEHGHGHGESHDDHGHDDHHGHHEISGEVDLNKVFVPLDTNLAKMISLIGVPRPEKTVLNVYEGEAKAKSQITPLSIPLITRNRVFHNDLANVSYEENPYFHPEPYGYLIVDDVCILNYSFYHTNLI
jgi:hypothetical protein